MAKFCGMCGQDIQPGETVCSVCQTPVEAAAKQETQDAFTDVSSNTAEQPQAYAPASQPVPQPAPQQAYAPAPQPVPQPAPRQAYAPAPQQAYAQQPVQQPYAPQYVQNENMAPIVSAGKFFGLTLLFSIPVVGFIMIIIMSFAPRNKTVKNYARSYLIAFAIIIVLLIIIMLLSLIFGISIMEFY